MKSVLSLLVVFSAAAWGGPIGYSVQYIPGLVDAYGVNNAGQVAGTTGNQAVIGHPAGHTLIPLPLGWTSSRAYSINASGQVTGSVMNSTNIQAFIGDASGSTAIPLPAGWLAATGSAVNESGLVAGYGPTGSGLGIFIGDASGSTEILLPAGWSNASLWGLNASGQVAGWGRNGAFVRPFIGDASGIVPIPLPAGWSDSAQAWAINDSGQVAGRGFNGIGWQAFLGDASGSTAIPLPTGSNNVYLDMGSLNNLGVIVGSGEGLNAGFIWDSVNGTRLLSDLVPAGWTIQSASSISDNGYILAYGTGPEGQGHLLLTPLAVPEPGTFALLSCGLAACIVAKRRRAIRY